LALEGEDGVVRRIEAALRAGPRPVGLLPLGLRSVVVEGKPAAALQQGLHALGIEADHLFIRREDSADGGGRWLAEASSWSGVRPCYAIEARDTGLQVLELSFAPRLVRLAGKLPGAAAEALLIRTLDSPGRDVAEATRDALIERRWVGFADTLREATNPQSALLWLGAMARASDLDVAWLADELLALRAQGESDVHPRWGALPRGFWAESLHGALFANHADAAAQAAIASALASPVADLREAALRELARWTRDVGSSEERRAAWRASGLFNRAAALAIDEKEPAVREAAASAAAGHADETQVAALDAPDLDRAIAAARLLAENENPTVRAAVGARMSQLAIDRSIGAHLRRRAGEALELAGETARLYPAITGRFDASDFAGALECIDNCLIALPDHANLHWWRGHALDGLGRLTDAAESFERSSQLASDASLIPRALAALYLRLGDAARAVREARRGVAIDATDADLQTMLAWALYRAGEAAEAGDVAAMALRLSPVEAEASWIAFLAALRTAKVEPAAQALAQLRRLRELLGPTWDAEWQSEILGQLERLTPDDAALQALRDEALALAVATWPPASPA
jgi:tetratricopeptide (TPR) repeat protein